MNKDCYYYYYYYFSVLAKSTGKTRMLYRYKERALSRPPSCNTSSLNSAVRGNTLTVSVTHASFKAMLREVIFAAIHNAIPDIEPCYLRRSRRRIVRMAHGLLGQHFYSYFFHFSSTCRVECGPC